MSRLVMLVTLLVLLAVPSAAVAAPAAQRQQRPTVPAAAVADVPPRARPASANHLLASANLALHPSSTSFRTTPWGHGRWSETLCGAAAHFYGRCTPAGWLRIAAANRIANPDVIRDGVVLRVPLGATRSVPARPVSRPAARTTSSTGWVHPLPGARCVSGWGAPRPGHTHKGVDLPAAWGTRIRAAHSGTVTRVRYQASGAGWYVEVDHGRWSTVYMHMRARSPLPVGSRVAAGQTIGYVGSTGHSSGPHLHFEVHDGARGSWYPINPSPFMRSVGVRVGC